MKRKIILSSLILIFLIGIVVSDYVPLSHAFHGTVTYENGSVVNNGEILAKIHGIVVESGEITDGEFGYAENFIVEQSHGDWIYIYVSGYGDSVSGPWWLIPGTITDLDIVLPSENSTLPINQTAICGNLIIETGEQCDDGNLINLDGCSSICQNESIIIPPINETNSTDDCDEIDTTAMRNHFIQFCDVNWECSGWTECSNGIMRRTCYDSNNCNLAYNKPVEEIGCENVLVEERENNYLFNYSWILLLIPTVIFILVLIWLLVGRGR